MHRCDVRKAFRRLKHKNVWGVPLSSFLGGFWHTPHTYHEHIKFLVCWRCLTLPQPHDCSTISAVKLSYRDRNGTGRTLDAKTTNTNPFETNHPHTLVKGRRRCVVSNTVQQTQTRQSFFSLRQTYYSRHNQSFCRPHVKNTKVCFCVGVLVPVTSNTSPCSQPWPINPIIYREPQQKPHLKTGFPLRCFQRLSLPHVANQPCHWRDNWHTRGTSIPVLSY